MLGFKELEWNLADLRVDLLLTWFLILDLMLFSFMF